MNTTISLSLSVCIEMNSANQNLCILHFASCARTCVKLRPPFFESQLRAILGHLCATHNCELKNLLASISLKFPYAFLILNLQFLPFHQFLFSFYFKFFISFPNSLVCSLHCHLVANSDAVINSLQCNGSLLQTESLNKKHHFYISN